MVFQLISARSTQYPGINMGLSLDQVIEMTTINPAKALGEEGRRGSLKPGMSADITVMELVEGNYLFGDGTGRESMKGNLLLEPRIVFKAGKSMPAYSNYHIPPLFT
jgi:dihydroorotase